MGFSFSLLFSFVVKKKAHGLNDHSMVLLDRLIIKDDKGDFYFLSYHISGNSKLMSGIFGFVLLFFVFIMIYALEDGNSLARVLVFMFFLCTRLIHLYRDMKLRTLAKDKEKLFKILTNPLKFYRFEKLLSVIKDYEKGVYHMRLTNCVDEDRPVEHTFVVSLNYENYEHLILELDSFASNL